jgi:hypothetical protein
MALLVILSCFICQGAYSETVKAPASSIENAADKPKELSQTRIDNDKQQTELWMSMSQEFNDRLLSTV